MSVEPSVGGMRNVGPREVRSNSITIGTSAEDMGIYRWTLEQGQLRLPDDMLAVAALLRLDESICQDAIDRLKAMRLLVPSATDSAELRPANPNLASAELTAELMAEIRQRQRDVHLLRATFKAFVAVYAENSALPAEGVPYQPLETSTAVQDALDVAYQLCQNEVMAIQPSGPRGERQLRLALPRDLRMLRRSVRIRMLYQHTARYNQNIRLRMEGVVAHGSQVRTRDQLPCPLIVFDRQMAFLPATGNTVGAVMVREPSTVDFASTMFDMMWEGAQDYLGGKQQDHEISTKLRHAIIRLLLQGTKDEVIARRLGVSVRTCRRHIAAIMDQLGATSRFQAGALIQRDSPILEQR